MNQGNERFIPETGSPSTGSLGYGPSAGSMHQVPVARHQAPRYDHRTPDDGYMDISAYSRINVDAAKHPGGSSALPVAQYIVGGPQDALYRHPVAPSSNTVDDNVNLVVKSPPTAYSPSQLPSLGILQRSHLGQETWAGETGALEQIAAQVGYSNQQSTGDAVQYSYDDSQTKSLCTFFVRTGTCAYGDRCKFRHPENRPPPQLNSQGYPLRPGEPDCPHYLKKGWCAFGLTCKFNHPEVNSVVPYVFPAQSQYVSPAQSQYVPYGGAYTVPNMYYVPSVPQAVTGRQVQSVPVAPAYHAVAPVTTVYRPSHNAPVVQVVTGPSNVPSVEQLARAMHTFQLMDQNQ